MKHWELLDTGASFQPLKFFNYHFFGQADDGLAITGYLHWLQVWDEASGCVTIDVYYPVNAQVGALIEVLIYINSVKHKAIEWRHGDTGLFALHIQAVMEYADQVPMAKMATLALIRKS